MTKKLLVVNYRKGTLVPSTTKPSWKNLKTYIMNTPMLPMQNSVTFRLEEEGVFETVFTTFNRELRYFAWQLLRNKEAAEDVVQVLFEKMWHYRNKYQFESIARVKAMLYTIVKNECLTSLERKKRLCTSQLETRLEISSEVTTLQTMIKVEILRELRREIESLPERCREVVILLYIYGKNNKEVAKLLNITENTVRNNRAYGIKLLRTTALKRFLSRE